MYQSLHKRKEFYPRTTRALYSPSTVIYSRQGCVEWNKQRNVATTRDTTVSAQQAQWTLQLSNYATHLQVAGTKVEPGDMVRKLA